MCQLSMKSIQPLKHLLMSRIKINEFLGNLATVAGAVHDNFYYHGNKEFAYS